jgi:hypothetical protein
MGKKGEFVLPAFVVYENFIAPQPAPAQYVKLFLSHHDRRLQRETIERMRTSGGWRI